MDPAAWTAVFHEIGQGAEIAAGEKSNRLYQPLAFTHEFVEFVPVADAPVTYYATFTIIAPHWILDVRAADHASGGVRIEALFLAGQQIGKPGHVRETFHVADTACMAITI